MQKLKNMQKPRMVLMIEVKLNFASATQSLVILSIL